MQPHQLQQAFFRILLLGRSFKSIKICLNNNNENILIENKNSKLLDLREKICRRIGDRRRSFFVLLECR